MNGTSGSALSERADTSAWSWMSSGHGDWRANSVRMVEAYSRHGLKSRPNDCSNRIRFELSAEGSRASKCHQEGKEYASADAET